MEECLLPSSSCRWNNVRVRRNRRFTSLQPRLLENVKKKKALTQGESTLDGTRLKIPKFTRVYRNRLFFPSTSHNHPLRIDGPACWRSPIATHTSEGRCYTNMAPVNTLKKLLSCGELGLMCTVDCGVLDNVVSGVDDDSRPSFFFKEMYVC